MAKKRKPYLTVTKAAEGHLGECSYIDVYGRPVGLTYKIILARLRKEFPEARTSLGSLRKIAYALNASKQRMPVRRRSPKILARDYARALLLNPRGIPYQTISKMVLGKFSEYPYIQTRQLLSLSNHLAHNGFAVPKRQ